MVPRSLCIRLHTCGALVFERITTKMDDGEKKKRKKERKNERKKKNGKNSWSIEKLTS